MGDKDFISQQTLPLSNMNGFGRGGGGRGRGGGRVGLVGTGPGGGCTCSRCMPMNSFTNTTGYGGGRGQRIGNHIENLVPYHPGRIHNETWTCHVSDCHQWNSVPSFGVTGFYSDGKEHRCKNCDAKRLNKQELRDYNKHLRAIHEVKCNCGCGKIVKHGKFDEQITYVDVNVFVESLLPLLDTHDICNLTQVSKDFLEYFSLNDIWKPIYIKKLVSGFYPQKLLNLAGKKAHVVGPTDSNQRLTIVIENKTDNVPMDVFWVKTHTVNQHPSVSSTWKKMTKVPIMPGKKYVCTSYPMHKWFCCPTEEWIREHPQSNIGFSFIVDIMRIQDYKFEKTSKPVFLKCFYQPNEPVPIKGEAKSYHCYKTQYMKKVVSISPQRDKVKANRRVKKSLKSDIERLKSTLKMYEKLYKESETAEKGALYALKVIGDKKSESWDTTKR